MNQLVFMKIAVLLATFNRKEKTLSCLERLRSQKLPKGAAIEIFLTDDASSDGTAEAVREQFPEVHVYSGNGTFFWAGGMRHTWKKSLDFNADYYLLLNDDTYLDEHAIATLLDCSRLENKNGKPCICIGSTIDPEGNISYGGRRLTSKFTWSSKSVHSASSALDCDFGNANILLVPAKIVEQIGILSSAYTHGLADYDYTLKARKAGFPIVVAPGFLGKCSDDHGNNWKPQSSTLRERIQYLKSPKGLAYKEYLGFIRDHFPLSYPSAFVKLWMKTFFPFIWDGLKK